jgi:hypothetical protein
LKCPARIGFSARIHSGSRPQENADGMASRYVVIIYAAAQRHAIVPGTEIAAYPNQRNVA